VKTIPLIAQILGALTALAALAAWVAAIIALARDRGPKEHHPWK
jgi:hypothetical protein